MALYCQQGERSGTWNYFSRLKTCKIFALDSTKAPITLVLAEDGTIVEDEDYFLCLPPNTKFLVLTGNKKWAPTTVDGGTAWLARDSVEVEDPVQMDGGALPDWKKLATQLRENLSNIILMSESDLQTLVEVPVEGLAAEMAVGRQQVQVLQDTLQSVLDRREEERQSKQLLQLYLEALKKEGVELTKASDAEGVDEVDSSCNLAEPSCNLAEPSCNLAEPSCKTQLTSHIVKILKEKDLPHLSFSNEQLEAVTLEDTEVLAVALDWKEQRTREVQGCCREELQRRAEQVQCLNSLASQSQSKKKKLP
ncbi:DNA fragmentation factor subunit alpha isoform X1 [Ascaphus truei]|uniref:DNA fragmentation factor subunit alpha isoform X1 n=1 Tax=Ascaphus truei TaxID=8439 RepID=UPI003F59282B